MWRRLAPGAGGRPCTMSRLWDIKTKMTDGGARSFTYLLISPTKVCHDNIYKKSQVLIFLCCMFVIAPATEVVPFFTFLFSGFLDGFHNNQYILSRYFRLTSRPLPSMSPMSGVSSWTITEVDVGLWKSPLAVLGVQIASGWLAYIFGKFACRCRPARSLAGQVQHTEVQLLPAADPGHPGVPGGAHPPVHLQGQGPLQVTHRPLQPSSTPAFPAQTFFECPAGSEDGSWLIKDHAWLWVLMFLSQVIFFTTFSSYFYFRSGSPLTYGPQKVAALHLPINCLGQASTTPFSSSRASLSTEGVMMVKNHASLTSRASILGR